MKSKIIAFLIVTLAIPSLAGAVYCPDHWGPEGDWDGDGLLNESDPCCFVTSADDNTAASVCNVDGMADLNGNGIPAEYEGMCCVEGSVDASAEIGVPHRSYCAPAYVEGDPGTPHCGQMGAFMVECDKLLLYDGMTTGLAGSNGTTISCGDSGCVCYTIGDYDGDDSTDGGLGGYHDGPFDNCPKDRNPGNANEGQLDVDGDWFGDACDTCREHPDGRFQDDPVLSVDYLMMNFDEMQCDIDDPEACPGGYCVPRAIRNPAYEGSMNFTNIYMGTVLVGNFCSAPADHDGDGVGDSCDNCPEDYNPSQKDQDQDYVGDACDICPDNMNIFEDEGKYENSDEDHVVDLCDNCPLIANADQKDLDQNGIGDVCQEEPVDTEEDTDEPEDTDDEDDSETEDEPEDTEEPEDTASDGDADGDSDSDSECKHCNDSEWDSGYGWEQDTGAVSFSGGGFISCQTVATGSGSGSILQLLVNLIF